MNNHSMLNAVWDSEELSLLDFWLLSKDKKHLTTSQLLHLCQYALLAPTTHNTIPERFRLQPEKNSIDVLLDRNYVLPESDVKGRQACISLGAVLFHLRAVADIYQLSCQITLQSINQAVTHSSLKDPHRFVSIARCFFTFSGRSDTDISMLKVIKQRKNVRAEYNRQAIIDEKTKTLIQKIADKYSDLEFHFLSNIIVRQGVAKFQEQADRYVLENKLFGEELGEWLLPNDEQATLRAMRGSEYGFDLEFSRTIHNGLSGNQRLLPDQIAYFAKGGKAGIESASAILVITALEDTPEKWLLAGQMYEEINLALYQLGYVSSMHAALTEVDWASAIFKTTILRSLGRPLVLFRVGKPKDPQVLARPHAVRPPIKSVLME